MRVLIADDDRTSIIRLRRTLQQMGYEVHSASNGTEALRALQEPSAPQLAIIDWMMPGLDGPDVIRRLRQTGDEPYTYAVLLTSRGDRQFMVQGLDAGADDFLSKPVHADELRARLRAGERVITLQRELIAARENLRRQALYDSLTGLMNRRAILEELHFQNSRADRDGQEVAVVLLDLDHFKKVNDTHGHPAGDEVLRQTAKRLLSVVREYDTVGRFGGEEFLVVLAGSTQPGVTGVAERLRGLLRARPVLFGGHEIDISGSFGLALRSDHPGVGPEGLIALADQALYHSKQRGRDCVSRAWPEPELKRSCG